MNKTTEILVGISNQTGMQLNEILNMMSKYYMYRNVLDLFLMFLIFIIMSLSIYLIYRYCKNKFEDEKYFDTMELCMDVFIPNIFIFLIVVIGFSIIENWGILKLNSNISFLLLLNLKLFLSSYESSILFG